MRLLRENHIGIEAFAKKKIVVRAGFDDAPLRWCGQGKCRLFVAEGFDRV